MNATFQEAMKALFRHMALELPPDGERNAYSVAVDEKHTIQFFAAPPAYLNIISDIGKLPEAVAPEFLRNLLSLNSFTFLYPELYFKVGVSKSGDVVELWVRQKLDGIEHDQMIDLFNSVLELTGQVQQWMERPLVKQRSAHHTARLVKDSDLNK